MDRRRLGTAGWSIAIGVALAGGARSFVSGQAPAGAPAVVRTDISGDWAVVSNEDQPRRGPGPELGDFTGLPINAAEYMATIQQLMKDEADKKASTAKTPDAD